MMRHREYYAKIEHRNHLAEALEAEVGCKNQYHLVSVACAWAQRAYSASMDGFYLGYHAAVAIEYAKQKPMNELVSFLEKTYHGGYRKDSGTG